MLVLQYKVSQSHLIHECMLSETYTEGLQDTAPSVSSFMPALFFLWPVSGFMGGRKFYNVEGHSFVTGRFWNF